MTLGAMRHRFDQISPTIPDSIPRRIGRHWLPIEEQKLPEADQPPDAKWRRENVRGRLARDSRQSAQVSDEVVDIADVHLCVARIGKCRIIVRSIRRYAAQDRVGDIYRTPGADAVDRIRRDVRYAERAIGGCQRQSAAETKPVRLTWRSMAGGTVTGGKDQPTF